MASVANALTAVDPERALALANDAEQAARANTNHDNRIQTLITVAEALAAVNPERALALTTEAEQSARTSSNPSTRAHTQVPQALAALAQGLALVGQRHRAEQAALNITDPKVRAQTLGASSPPEMLARAGQWNRAHQIALRIAIPIVRARLYAVIAQALAAEDPDRALALAIEAEQTASTRTTRKNQSWVLIEIGRAFRPVGPVGSRPANRPPHH